MVADRLLQPDAQRGYILDGFPRTLPQADWLDQHLLDSGSALPVVAISIVVEYDRAVAPDHRTTYLPRLQEDLQYLLESSQGWG